VNEGVVGENGGGSISSGSVLEVGEGLAMCTQQGEREEDSQLV